MKKTIFALLALTLSMTAVSAYARNTLVTLPVSHALQVKDKEGKLDGSVKFFFGHEATPKILSRLGSDSAHRKTNGVSKSDTEACNWAFLSALIALQGRAQQLGANAVVNIVSVDKGHEPGDGLFDCRAGGLMAGVHLKGDFVKIADK